jgi:Vacuolar import and degradation protein
MPTPQLDTVLLTTSAPLDQQPQVHDINAPVVQSIGAPTITPAASSVPDIVPPKSSPGEDVDDDDQEHDFDGTRDSHAAAPFGLDDTQTAESDQRSVLSHGSLASPEPASSTTDESVRRNENGSNNALIYNLDFRLYRQLPEARYRPNSTSTFLKPGARFSGIQSSEKQQYEVVVDVQHVDMADSFMCGYLRIHALTEEHPTLTTYFEGEMIGSKYSFVTKHPEWGANEKVDFQHWARFPAWRPLQKDAKKANFSLKNWSQKENIWMRWKEYFLVPDHTVKDLTGASFDGFYYICFNQISGAITGTYYHLRSEKYVFPYNLMLHKHTNILL